VRFTSFCFIAFLLFPSLTLAQTPAAEAPVFEIAPSKSSIKFAVKATVSIEGTFDKWEASLKFKSPEATTAVLDVKIQAASVDTGSSIKDNTLNGEDFFDVARKSTTIVQTGANTFEVDGNFTIRGVTKPERLTLTVSGRGTGSGEIKGTMAFDRKDYGMNSGIPFIRIANRVEVSVKLIGKRVSGPPVVFRQ
jgi:polyisoprenoid-binding protein YceI